VQLFWPVPVRRANEISARNVAQTARLTIPSEDGNKMCLISRSEMALPVYLTQLAATTFMHASDA